MPASPRTRTPTINPAIDAPPTSPPNPLGITPRAPLAGVLVSTAFRVISGQSPQQALFVATGESLGSVAGAVVGSVLGPAGTFIGGVAGGFVGGAVADFIFGQTRPKKAELPVGPVTGLVPFTGGQGKGVLYLVTVEATVYGDFGVYPYTKTTNAIPGPITGLRVVPYFNPYNNRTYQDLFVECGHGLEFLNRDNFWENYRITKIVRYDQQPDTGGDPPPLPIAKDTRTRDSINHPGNQEYAVPSGTPLSRQQRPTPDNYIPGGTASKSNGTPRGDSPDWVGHGGLKGTPHPVNMPRPLAPPLPTVAPARSPSPNASPEDVNQPFPRSNNRPDFGNFSPPNSVELKFPSAAPVSTTVAGIPIPDANKPAPITNAPGTGLTPLPTPESQTRIQEDLKKKIDELGLGLVAVTALIQGIANNTTPVALEPTIEKAVCRTTQPGGCTRNLTDDLKNGQNSLGNKLDAKDAADALAQGEQLRLLNQLDAKLGPQITNGGVSGFMQRTWQVLQVDRALNVLTFVNTTHNAYMLSNGLTQTLFSMISNVLAVVGIKDADGNPLNISSIIGKTIQDLFKSVLGTETVDGIKAEWAQYSRIYQATTNLANSIQNMMQSVQNVIEVTGEYTGKIGNALKRFGVVGERAYSWMSENMNTRTSWFAKLETGVSNATQTASNLDQIASETLNITQTYNQLKTQVNEFDAAVKTVNPNQRENNEPVKTASDTAKSDSQSASISADDLIKPEAE